MASIGYRKAKKDAKKFASFFCKEKPLKRRGFLSEVFAVAKIEKHYSRIRGSIVRTLPW